MASVVERILKAALPELTVGVGAALPALRSLTLQGTSLAGDIINPITVEGVVQRLPKLSANEVIRQVRSMGFSLRRQNALAAIKSIRSQSDSYEYISNLSPGRKPLMNRIPFTDTRQRLKYQYTVVITGQSSLTGEESDQFIRINSPRLLTKNEAVGFATDVLFSSEQYEIDQITTAEVTLITRQNPNIGEGI